MRLIDADAFWDELEELRKYASPDFSPEIYRMQVRIAAQTTIEPVPTESEFKRIAIQRGYVPVVRCKECRYFVESAVSKTSFCKRQERMIRMRLDDFCSYGERRTDD